MSRTEAQARKPAIEGHVAAQCSLDARFGRLLVCGSHLNQAVW